MSFLMIPGLKPGPLGKGRFQLYPSHKQLRIAERKARIERIERWTVEGVSSLFEAFLKGVTK